MNEKRYTHNRPLHVVASSLLNHDRYTQGSDIIGHYSPKLDKQLWVEMQRNMLRIKPHPLHPNTKKEEIVTPDKQGYTFRKVTNG